MVNSYKTFEFALLLMLAGITLSCGPKTMSGLPIWGPGGLIQPTSEYHPSPTSGLPGKPEDGSTFWRVFYFPYVEEVIVPDTVIANQAFEVTLKVSAEYRPAILFGSFPSQIEYGRVNSSTIHGYIEEPLNPMSDGLDNFRIPEDYGTYLDTRINFPMGSGEPTNKFTYNLAGFSAGQVRLSYYTTTSREYGGIGWFYSPSKGPMPGDPVEWLSQYVVKKEIVIAVLPAEGCGAGGLN